MPGKDTVTLPYDRVYVLGDSLSSIQNRPVNITITFDFWCYSYTEKANRTLPNPRAYYSNRFTNGPNFYDHLKGLMPELPLQDDYVFAYQGAGSNHNAINFYVRESIDQELGWWKSWVSSTIINTHPSFDDQFQQIIDKENSLTKESQKGRPLIFVWGAGIHNDIICLPYLAGYSQKWSTLPNITRKDVQQFSLTLNSLAKEAGEKLKSNITKLYDAGVKDIVIFDGLPIERTPYFTDLKKKYTNVKGFGYFIDNMASIYNAALKASAEDLQKTFVAEGKPINITYITSEDLTLPTDLKSVAFVDEDGMRHGQPFQLKNATPEEKFILANSYFYDPIHLSTRGAFMVASFVKDQLRQKEANIKKYHSLCTAKQKQQVSSNLDVQPKDQYIMITAQKNNACLGLSGK